MSHMLSLDDLRCALPEATVHGAEAVTVTRVNTDTRTLKVGDLFVALCGEHFDGHDFVQSAAQMGATAALVQRHVPECQLPQVVVPDTRQALGKIARFWREKYHGPLIAITGSNGKTTVTQMVACILRAWHGDESLATQGNFNNDIGVPLTLLRLLPATHRSAVLELGMNHPGEIATLSDWVKPTVALVNNAQREHQEFMATVEAVALENGSVFAHLSSEGTAVYPHDAEFSALWARLASSHRRRTFALMQEAPAELNAMVVGVPGSEAGNDTGAVMTMHSAEGVGEVRLNVLGRHNLYNALAAATCSLAAGVPWFKVVEGLNAFRPVKGRSALLRVETGAQTVNVLDDTYNANPDSVRAAIDVLAGMSGPRGMFLGDMGEVGDQGPAFHAEVGQYAAARGVAQFWTAGSLSRYAHEAFVAHASETVAARARHFEDVPALLAALGDWMTVPSVVVKGSRFMKMERVVGALCAAPDEMRGATAPAGGHHAA